MSARTVPPTPPEAPLATGEFRRSCAVFLTFLAVAIVFTWPLAPGLARDVPYDLGDSLLNMWILSWNAEQLRQLLGGDWSVLFRWFDGNIFYPTPNTLAYSEHLIAQSVQIFPIYLATGNPILCYNLLFLSTYALSGLGAYLFVRELTGDRRAAFVAGCIFAFIPYRVPQASHLQVLSSQWMPFALFGVTRYLNTGRRVALAGGAAALLVQALSCGYYLVYFSPFAAAYLVWELARRGRLADRRAWIDIAVAAIVSASALIPFLLPYARARDSSPLTRSLAEVGLFSADVYAYLTAFPIQRFWGPLLQTAPRGEGELFMGAVPMLLAAVSGILLLRRGWRETAHIPARHPFLSTLLGAVFVVVLTLSIAAIYAGRLSFEFGGLQLRIVDIGRPLLLASIAGGLCLLLTPRLRSSVRTLGSVEGFFLLAIIATWWLSLGPMPTSLGEPLQMPAPYRLLYLLPGVDGVRVPARLAMVMALMLAGAAGFVIARLPRTGRGTLVAAVLIAAFAIEAPASAFPLNGVIRTPGFGLPERRVYPPETAPAMYRAVAELPGHVVLLELPIGDANWDVRAVYYSATHWRPLVNGYSGFFPPHYHALATTLREPEAAADQAQQLLRDSGATHVLVHDQGFSTSDAAAVRRWLEARGARVVASEAGDTLYDIRR